MVLFRVVDESSWSWTSIVEDVDEAQCKKWAKKKKMNLLVSHITDTIKRNESGIEIKHLSLAFHSLIKVYLYTTGYL